MSGKERPGLPPRSPRGMSVRKPSPRSASTVSEMSSNTPKKRKARSSFPRFHGTPSSQNNVQIRDDAEQERADREFAANYPHDEDSEDEDVDDDYEENLQQQLLEQLQDLQVEISASDMSYIESGNREGPANDGDIYGAPPGWRPPTAPDDFKPKEKNGCPEFKDLDNPGHWNPFHFQAKYEESGRGKYKHHELPTGARPVPKNDDGVREIEGWEFNYDGSWVAPEGSNFRHGANRDDVFPPQREGSLNDDMLRKMGMSKERMQDPKDDNKVDAAFFFQVVRPFCDPKRSGIKDDP